MSTVFEPAIGGGLAAKTGNGNGSAVRREREIRPLGINAQKVVAKRYSLKDENGERVETWDDIVRRVVGHVSRAETDPAKARAFYNRMTEVMLAREFIPNTPCLVNAGKPKASSPRVSCSNVPDSIEGIMEHAQNVAIIHQTGGGTGMTYEFLRPAGSMVNSTRGVASGPGQLHEHRQPDDRGRKAGRCPARCEHGHSGRHASGHSPFHSRKERPDEPDEFQYLGDGDRSLYGRGRQRHLVPDRIQRRAVDAGRSSIR